MEAFISVHKRNKTSRYMDVRYDVICLVRLTAGNAGAPYFSQSATFRRSLGGRGGVCVNVEQCLPLSQDKKVNPRG